MARRIRRIRSGRHLMTASGRNLIRYFLNRKGALPRAVRESRDYDSAVRAIPYSPVESRDY